MFGGRVTVKFAQLDRRILGARRGNLGIARAGLDGILQLETLHDGPQDRVRLDELDLGGKELVGIVIARLRIGILANEIRRDLAVDIDRGGGFVNRREPGRNHDRGDDRGKHECQDFPAPPLQDPEIVG